MTGNISSVRRKLADNLKRIRERVAEACLRARRDPAGVTIVAVTKEVEIDIARQALEAGIADLGESRAQQFSQRAAMLNEFVSRRAVLGGGVERALPRPRWHMIGHLQRNKIKLVLPWADLIHSVDSLRLAEDISHHAEKSGREASILLEVNTSGEVSKFGVAVGAVSHMVEHLVKLPRLRLRGLMTMAPLDAKPHEIRLYFDRLRELLEELRGDGGVGPDCDQLSMGMSNDYPIAVEAGSTLVRLGHAMFEGLIPTTPGDADDEAES